MFIPRSSGGAMPIYSDHNKSQEANDRKIKALPELTVLDSASTHSTLLRLDSNSVLTSWPGRLLFSTPVWLEAVEWPPEAAAAAAVTKDLTSVTGVVVEILCRRPVKVTEAAVGADAGFELSVVVVKFVVVVVSDTSIVESEPFSALVFLPSVLQLL